MVFIGSEFTSACEWQTFIQSLFKSKHIDKNCPRKNIYEKKKKHLRSSIFMRGYSA